MYIRSQLQHQYHRLSKDKRNIFYLFIPLVCEFSLTFSVSQFDNFSNQKLYYVLVNIGGEITTIRKYIEFTNEYENINMLNF